AGRHRYEIPLPGDFAAAEDGVALGIDGLDECGVDAVAAGRKRVAAENAGRLPENEVIVIGVINLGVEAEIALETPQAELGAIGGFFFFGGGGGLETARRVVGPRGGQLRRARGPVGARA